MPPSAITIATLVAASIMAWQPGARGMEQDPIDKLAAELKSQDAERRRAAVASLRKLGRQSTMVVRALIEALSDKDNVVRSRAITSLGQIGPSARSAIPVLARLAGGEEKSEVLRYDASTALGRIGPDALPALIDLLKSRTEPEIRDNAAHAIGLMGPEARTAIPFLMEALADSENDVWNSAADSLVKIGTDAVQELRRVVMGKDECVRGRAGFALLKIIPSDLQAIRIMVRDLEADNIDVRQNAVYSLKTAPPAVSDEIVPALTKALKDEDDFVRSVAASNLANLGPRASSAILALTEALKDPDSLVRLWAAEALGNTGSQSQAIVDILMTATQDEDEDVRIVAVCALGKIGPKAVSAEKQLESMLRKKAISASLRRAIRESLEQMKMRK